MERPYFKERLFGLTNNQETTEDVKELYFHQVSTPTFLQQIPL
jgi:hypothetical protein